MSADKPKSRRRTLLIIAGALIALIFGCGLLTAIFGDSPPAEETTQPTATLAAPTEPPTVAPTAIPTEPPPTAEPTAIPATLSPEESLRAGITADLGRGNRDVDRITSIVDDNGRIEVDWAINDNLSENLTQGGAQLDATNILKAIAQSGYDYEFVLMRGTFPLVDQLGNVTESKVVELFFSRELVDKINFANFDHRNVYEIADSADIHPAFVRQ